VTTIALPRPPATFQVGRAFLRPFWDYALIAALPSLAVFALLRYGHSLSFLDALASRATAAVSLPIAVLACGSAHFAASTVRLYTKPNAFRDLRFATLQLPLLTLAVVTLALAFSPYLGQHLVALYTTWSPYHYAAQAYGLALMYCYRSGCRLSDGDRRLLRAACLAPFLYAFVQGTGNGLGWLLPLSWSAWVRTFLPLRPLEIACFVLPVLWFGRLAFVRRSSPPVISLLIVVANGFWWTTLTFLNAFVWATVFHAVQYLAIVTVAHVKDRVARPGNAHGWLYHSLWFYATCLALAYALFVVWPMAYVGLGFGVSESMLLVTATINIHHFIVDGYIWRLRKGGNAPLVATAAVA
jgi:hypothetical protein